MVGIVSYGAYIPRYRIKVSDIARVWGKDGEHVSQGLRVKEKAVAAIDEDSCTIAVETAKQALGRADIDPRNIGAIFVGSESKPFAVNPSASTVAEAIGAVPNVTGADLEFACKAGTAGMQAVYGMVKSKMIKYGMAIGADTAQGKPNDALEFTAASGGAAFIIGDQNVIAELEDTCSFSTDTPDFWRRAHQEFPEHGGRFTAEPAYYKHVIGAAEMLREKMGFDYDDFDHVVFHQPNGKFPLRAAKKLKIPFEKLSAGYISPVVGNTYSGNVPLALSAVLDIAKPGEKILVVSYGSGAGSDAFSFKVTPNIKKVRKAPFVKDFIEDKVYIDYAIYAKFRKKIKSI